MINENTYSGSITPENVFEAICGAFEVSPKSCLFLNNKYSVFMKYSKYRRKDRTYKFFVKSISYIVTLVLLFICGVAIYVMYEKMYNQFLSRDV
jgi:hypothetical protein